MCKCFHSKALRDCPTNIYFYDTTTTTTTTANGHDCRPTSVEPKMLTKKYGGLTGRGIWDDIRSNVPINTAAPSITGLLYKRSKFMQQKRDLRFESELLRAHATVSRFLPVKGRKASAHDVIYSVHDVMSTDCQTQNGSTLGRVFATF